MLDDAADGDVAICYICHARIDGTDRFFCWSSGGSTPDYVVVDEQGLVPTSSTEVGARELAARECHQVSSEPPLVVYDLDEVETWSRSGSEVVACKDVLNLWNLVSDLPLHSELFAKADEDSERLYDKVFMGCNLPSMSSGDVYVPYWSAPEIKSLKRLLLLGVAEFRSRLKRPEV